MNTHSIDLIRYRAQSRGNSTIYLGTAGSHGNEQLQVTQGKGWEGLTVQVVFHPCKVAVQLPANGLLDVPWEATAQPLSMMQGRIVFQGFDQDRLVNSTDLAYTVASHSPVLGRDEEPYTPGIVEGVLNQMAADKDAILQAAQQTGQAKEAAAASAAEAASSAANAQQSAGAANTSVGQAAASASQAAGSAAAANETLTQVQTAGQEAQQKVKDAESEALGNISAAAPALPAVSAAAAWQSVTVKPDGTGYNLAAMAPIEATIRPTVTGNPAVCEDSAAWAFQGLKIYGKSTQDGTPSPENPVPIVSAGDEESINLICSNKNIVTGATVNTNVTGAYSSLASVTSVAAIIKKGEPYFLSLKISCNGTSKAYWNARCGLFSNNETFEIQPGTKVYTKSGIAEGDLNSTIKFDVCNISSTGSSEPVTSSEFFIGFYPSDYVKNQNQSLTVSTPNGLPGIPVTSGGNFTDADGQQWICNEIDLKRGVLIQRTKTFSDLTFSILQGGVTEYSNLYESKANIGILKSGYPSAFCSNLQYKNGLISSNETGFYIYGGSIRVRFANSKNETEDIETIKSYTFLTLLETPIEIPLSAEELAAYKALATYDGTTVVSTAEPVAGIEASYVMDGNKYRESVDKRLAALEAAQTGI